MMVTDTGWNTSAMAMSDYRDGISPSKASIIVRQFESCSECGEGIDPDVNDGLYQDRDVIWENNSNYDTTAHTCQHCEAELRIFVEEKAFGVIGEEQLPGDAEERDDLYFVPVEGEDSYLVINPFQMSVSKATPANPASEGGDAAPAQPN